MATTFDISANLTKLSKDQRSLYDQYHQFKKDQIGYKEQILTLLNRFYLSLETEKQNCFKNWFSWQLCQIDSKLMPSLKMTEFIEQHYSMNNFAISDDGKSFILVFDDKNKAKSVMNNFIQLYPNLSYDLQEVKHG